MNYQEKIEKLTKRECEVLDLFCQGMTHERIGEALFIAPETVRSHLHHIYTKLDLLHLPRRARAYVLKDDYWQLAKDALREGKTDPPIEILDAIPAGVDQAIDEDEKVIRSLVVVEQPKNKSARRGFSIPCSVIALLLILGGAAWFVFLGGGIQAAISILATHTPTATSSPTSTITFTSSSTSTISATPTLTATFTNTPVPTNAPTLTPTFIAELSSAVELGPVYEVGEWHKEGDIWLRLVDYSVDWEGIYLTIEMWNRTGQPMYFQWSTNYSMFLRDNVGNRYTVDSRFEGNQDNEIVPANSQTIIGSDPYTDLTNWYDPDNLFLPGVTELYFTVDTFGGVERATWRIPISN